MTHLGCTWVVDLNARSAEAGKCDREASVVFTIVGRPMPPGANFPVCEAHRAVSREWLEETYGYEHVHFERRGHGR